jgi:hypothetical protein
VNGNDPSNCGGCGTVCSANHVTPQCSGGACTGACAGGYADCNGNKQADGCEINLTNDPGHCGACANICSSNHVTPTCGNSVCNGVCQAGFADCNGSKLTDGCETAILSDPANCGGCGVTCGMLQTCQGGGCVGQVLAGSYDVNSGPVWNTNPPTYTCLEACVVKFGAGSYSCSTVSTSVNHLAWVSGYASTVHCAFVGTSPVSESYKLNATYDCGAAACSYSAYVQDVCSEGMPASINYCFR